MIAVKGNGQFAPVNTNILAVRCQHVEIAAQRHIALCGRDVLSLHDLLPLPIANAILTLELNFGHGGADRLRTASVIDPHHQNSKKDQQQNTHNL